MLWGSSYSRSPCNGTSFLPSQEANVFVLALIYYSIWGSFVYAHSVEAKFLFRSVGQFQEAAFLKLARAFLHVTFSLPINLLDPRAAPLWSESRHSVAFSERESLFWHTRAGFQRRFSSQNYFQDFSIFQCCPTVPKNLATVIPDDSQRGTVQVLSYILSTSLWLCCAWPTDTCSKEPTLYIMTLHFLDAKKVPVGTVWFSPTMHVGWKPGMMPCHKEDSGVSRQGRCWMGMRGLLPPCPEMRLVHTSQHTWCRRAPCCSSLTPFSDEAKHGALLGFASIINLSSPFPSRECQMFLVCIW